MAISSPIARRTFLKGSAAVLAMGALAGCGGTDMNEALQENAAKEENPALGEGDPSVVARAYLANPTCIDPYDVQERYGLEVTAQLFDPLTSYNYETGELEPLAAREWTSNEDATEFNFHLVTGATFANGEPVTAEAFKRAWTRIVDPQTNPTTPSAIAYRLAMVKGYQELADGEATDFTGVLAPADDLLVVMLSAPYADFPYVCSLPALSPVPQAALDDPGEFWLAPIGNGPFMMDGRWEDGQEIRVVRYDGYYGFTKATIQGVDFSIKSDMETGWRSFKAGNLDLCEVPAQEIGQAIEDYGESEDGYTVTPGHQVLTGEEMGTYFLTVNNEDGKLSDPELRKAISLAIDRQAICDAIFHGSRTPADNIVPPSMAGYEPEAWPYARYDKGEAERIIEENGFEGTDIELVCDAEGGHEEIMAMIQADLAAVGINATIDTREWAAMLDDYAAGDYQVGRLSWYADYPLLDDFLYPLFSSESADNRSRYDNPVVDGAIRDARSIVDDDERTAALQEANRLIGEDCPVIPIMYFSAGLCGSNRIIDLRCDPNGIARFALAQMRA